ncbi:MAG: BatD family protein [Synechococcus sp.]
MIFSVRLFPQRLSRNVVLAIASAILILCGAAPVHAQEAPPSAIVRTSLSPDGELIVGQQVRLYVDVLVETWFDRAPRFPDIQVPNAIALRPSGATTNLSERIDGRLYSGIRRSYYIYPQEPGPFTIPTFQVKFTPAPIDGAAPESVSLSTETARFTAVVPPEVKARDLDYAIATDELTIEDSFDREPTDIQVGDAIQRNITISASDTVGAVLPPPPFPSFTGLNGYVDPPKIANSINRGNFVGRRTDTITYVAERGGRYRLPAIRVSYWNIDTQSLKTEALPAVTLRVRLSHQAIVRRVGLVIASVLGLMAISRYYRHPLRRFLSDYRKRQAESEAAYFRRVRQACERGEPKLAMQALQAWAGRLGDRLGISSPSEVMQQCDDTALTAEWLTLTHLLYGAPAVSKASSPSQAWSGSKFFQLLQANRRHLLGQSKLSRQARLPLLLLNPASPISRDANSQ